MKPKFMTLIAAMFFVFLFVLSTSATIIPNVITDTIYNLKVTWTWNPEQTDIWNGTATLINWYASLSITEEIDTYDVRIEFRHKTNPHADETTPDIKYYGFNFLKNAYGTLHNNNKIEFLHPGPQEHFDTYTFKFYREQGSPANNLITLTGSHPIPEPAAMLLLSIGGILLRKKK